MNNENLTELAIQLELGAPGVAFCLGAPRTTVEQALGSDADPFDVGTIEQQCAAKGLGPLDIACGLDGYAVQLFAPDYPLGKDMFYDPLEQECLTRRAVDLLGLPWMEKGPKWGCGHDLFEPPDRSWEYTPEQTAQAVYRLIAGKQPWK
ncbi:hypothetical protein NBRC116590_32080 [Pelagimonas sp. KU-00592-HH]|uniref:hypothetical protein n=1 Tax=Pelagimonas sp. KU-00592-HH TaxID=3127651 RepID=UPI00310B32A9